jgi:hypothetical protein
MEEQEKPVKTGITDIEVAKKLINIYQSAQDRKLQFNLSFEYVKKMLEYKTCYYTGKPFTEDGPNARSFDRVDSDKGYIEGNVVACTIEINGKKSNLSFEEISCLYLKMSSKKEKDAAKELAKIKAEELKTQALKVEIKESKPKRVVKSRAKSKTKVEKEKTFDDFFGEDFFDLKKDNN